MTKVNKPSCVCIASYAWSPMFKASKVYWWTSWNGNGCHAKGVSWGPSSSSWGTRYDSVSLKMGVSWCCRNHRWFAFVLCDGGILFSVFSIVCITSLIFGDYTHLQHQATTFKIITHFQGSKILDFQLVLWTSISHFLLPLVPLLACHS